MTELKKSTEDVEAAKPAEVEPATLIPARHPVTPSPWPSRLWPQARPRPITSERGPRRLRPAAARSILFLA